MANYVRFYFCAENMRRKTRNKQINNGLKGTLVKNHEQEDRKACGEALGAEIFLIPQKRPVSQKKSFK